MRENAKVVAHGKFNTFLLIYDQLCIGHGVFRHIYNSKKINRAVESTQ